MTQHRRARDRDGVELSAADFRALFDAVCTWGRWGEDDERGALNELTADRVVAATRLVRSGETVTLGLPLNTRPGVENPEPAVHRMTMLGDVDIGSGTLRFAKDYIGVDYHNDGLSHTDGTGGLRLTGVHRAQVGSSLSALDTYLGRAPEMKDSARGPCDRHRRWALLIVALSAMAVVTMPALATGREPAIAAQAGSGPSPPYELLPAPPVQVPPLLNRKKVDRAVRRLDTLVHSAMRRTGVPGVAVAAVYHDKVIYSKGFGVRKVGKPAKVDSNTVFQVASVSKPLASTVVAGVVGRKTIGWDDPVIKYNPLFALSDPYVTEHATFADFMSHRSGLFTGSGDLLEDLGFDRGYILGHLNQQPLDAFRSTYNYSNFGFTEAGQAAADGAGVSWEDLAQRTLFGPLGMKSSSYRHSDYEKRADKALIHVRVGDHKAKKWQAKYVRNADAEAPAGGASSSVKDLAQFVRLQLGRGALGGKRIIAPAALQTTHVPHQELGPPPTAAARTQFYGLGWNVTYDDEGRLKLDHSGAFALGAATNVAMLPGEDLGIVTLTNGQPIGVPEAINNAFFDAAQHGRPTVDWLDFFDKAFEAVEAADKPAVDYSKRPANATPAQANGAYTGTYSNPYYGPLTVRDVNGKLSMTLGPASGPTVFALTPYNGDTFSFQTIGEWANGLAGAIFKAGADGTIASVTLDFYDRTGLGTFVRS